MTVWRLVDPGTFSEEALFGFHNHWVCLLAVALAVLAAWVLLPVIHRFHSARPGYRYSWLVAGSLGMGTGIWAMHFTGMLAYRLPLAVSYDPLLTALSIVPAIIASAGCIYLFKPKAYSLQRLHCCALLLAAGIGAMHYTGMEAIIVAADMYYVPAYFLLSLLAAYLLALIGLYARIKLAHNSRRFPPMIATATGSVILGAAVSGMHFLAMHATYFQANGINPTMTHTAMPVVLMVGIIGVTVLLCGLIIIGAVVDRRMKIMAMLLERSELRFQRLAESTHTAIFTFNHEAVLYANPALGLMTDHRQEQLLDKSLADILGGRFSDWALHILATGSPSDSVFYEQFEIRSQSGETRWIYVSLVLVETDNQCIGLGSAIDISKQKNAELNLRELAYSDPLTKLSNRTRFMDRLAHHLALIRRNRLPPNSCVMILDLDGFKLVNDTYGHLVGDKLLIEVARRISRVSRHCDTLARFGGDEFVMLVEELGAHLNIATIAERILDSLSAAYDFVDCDLSINISIGIVELNHQVYDSCDHVLHDADVALYRAKAAKRGHWVLFDSELDAHTKRGRLIQAELKTALAERQLQLYYQPIFEAGDRQLVGFEALARWQRSNGEWVSPEEFILLAEKAGMITDIGLWVLDTACRQLHDWRHSWPNQSVYISINVASESFADDRFYRNITQLFEQYRFERGLLKLELTETMLVSETEQLLVRLNGLIELGCELMIDDFGTGYSSLAYLCRLPIGTLKIDRSFVAKLADEEQTAQVVRTIIALAKTLQIKVISEGVETEQQAAELARMGSDQLQGYLLGRPLPASQIAPLMPASTQARQLNPV